MNGSPSPRAIEDISPEWDELADRTGASPFLRPGWLAAWWKAFGRGRLEVITARRDGRLAGVLPVRWRGRKASSPTNWHTPVFGFPTEGDDVAEELALRLLSARPRHLSLGFLDPGDAGVANLRRMTRRSRYTENVRTLMRSPYVLTDGDWDAYQHRLGHGRAEIRRRQKRLREQGPVSFEIADGRDRLEELLHEGFLVERSGWKGARGTAIDSHDETRRFYAEVARWAARKGWLRLAFLRLDGRPVAFQLCLEHDRVMYLVKTGYDHAHHRFSPGKLIQFEILASAFSSHVRAYEFLGADEAWKLDWTDACRDRVLFQAFGPSFPGRLERLVYVHGRPLAKRALRRARGRMPR